MNRRRPKAEVIAAAKGATIPAWLDRTVPLAVNPGPWTIRMQRELTRAARAYATGFARFNDSEIDEAALALSETALEFAAWAFAEALKRDTSKAHEALLKKIRKTGKA